MNMPIKETTADTEIAYLKRTLKHVNNQNSALIKECDSLLASNKKLETLYHDLTGKKWEYHEKETN